MENRIFGLDPQLLADSVILALSVFFLFLALSYLLFQPAREFMEKRRQKIKEELSQSETNKDNAARLKQQYEIKLQHADETVHGILQEARDKARKNQEDILKEAKIEASILFERAEKEIEQKKLQINDEVKQEVVTVAALMAGKFIEHSMNPKVQEQLLEETLKDLGEKTWLG